VEKASISSAGAFTSTTIDATKLTGNLPAISGASLTNLPAGGVDGITSSADATAITIDSNENVGIGVVPESAWRSSTTAIQFGGLGSLLADTSQAAGSGVYLTNNSYLDASNWKHIITDEASDYSMFDGQHRFRTAPSGTAGTTPSWTTAMTILNTGKTTLGTTASPGARLGVTYDGWNYGDGIDMYDTYSGSYSNYAIKFIRNGSVVGGIMTNLSSTAYNTSSDYRLKENVVPMTGSIDRLKALKPSKFNFIADAETTVDGFLAHEAQEVVPEAITGTKDAMKTEEYEVTPAVMDGEKVVTEAVMGEREVEDYQGIDQSKLVPLLVASLQEAIARIEVLEAQLKA